MNLNQKTIIFFVLALLAGYAVSVGLMLGLLNAPLRLYGWGSLTVVAFLVAILLVLWLDKPFELGIFKWSAPQPKKEIKSSPYRVEELKSSEAGAPVQMPGLRPGVLFPHEVPSDHWDTDFGDSKKVYQGADLPLWILAGWAAFILWAVAYLVSGLSAF
jgi:hypothetical protein